MVDKEKLRKWLGLVQVLAMIGFVFGVSYVFFFATDNVCVEPVDSMMGTLEDIDKGERCFRTITEVNNYTAYLIEKYDIGKEQDLFLPVYNFTE